MAKSNPEFDSYRRLQRAYYDKTGIWASSKGWDKAKLKRKAKSAGIDVGCGGSCGCSSCSSKSRRKRKKRSSGKLGPYDSILWSI